MVKYGTRHLSYYHERRLCSLTITLTMAKARERWLEGLGGQALNEEVVYAKLHLVKKVMMKTKNA